MFLAPHTGKYYLWNNLYPELYTPPSYCNGQCAMLTASAAEKIYEAAQNTDRHEFRLEDFYFVGILRTKGTGVKLFIVFYQTLTLSVPTNIPVDVSKITV